MAFNYGQVVLVANVDTPLWGPGGAFAGFSNTNGTVQDPVPVSIKNEDAAEVVWWGGPGVTDADGQSIPPGGVVIMNIYGASEIPHVYSTGTPTVSVVLGRQ